MSDTAFQSVVANLYFRNRMLENERALIVDELCILLEIADRAAKLHSYIGENNGRHEDFPLKIQSDDDDVANELASRLNALREVLLELPPLSERFPLPGDSDAAIEAGN